jgi:hypothetical protein
MSCVYEYVFATEYSVHREHKYNYLRFAVECGTQEATTQTTLTADQLRRRCCKTELLLNQFSLATMLVLLH